jgi:hypothetical protein
MLPSHDLCVPSGRFPRSLSVKILYALFIAPAFQYHNNIGRSERVMELLVVYHKLLTYFILIRSKYYPEHFDVRKTE